MDQEESTCRHKIIHRSGYSSNQAGLLGQHDKLLSKVHMAVVLVSISSASIFLFLFH